jgi:hypothetical protein
MDTGIIIALVVIALLVIAAVAAFVMMRKKHSEELRTKFGPEYDRAVEGTGRRSEAEKELDRRAERVQKLHIKELSADDQQRFAEEWRQVQARFVDDPSATLGEADKLVQRVMDKKGYPVSDFEQQAADISVEHPEVVNNYREAHGIAEAHEREGASTESLRQAMIHYRALFSELLGEVATRR